MAEPRAAGERTLLVTGATGYVGGRLARALLDRGERVRALARRAAEAHRRLPAGMDVVGGDVLDEDTLGPAVEGVDTAYYLVHSMGSSGDFEERDGCSCGSPR